jgi:hypothetical protein
MPESDLGTTSPLPTKERGFVYRIVRYTPNLERDEWLNIGVLVFHPETGERRLRLIEDEDEYRRVRRLIPLVDETVLRALRDDLETKMEAAEGGSSGPDELQRILTKWDETFADGIQFAPPKGTLGADLDAELERLYADRVAVPRVSGRTGIPGSRGNIRSYCAQVFKQARVWDRLEKSVRVADFTFPGDPLRLDYSYRRNGTRGFVQGLSVTHSPRDAKELAYTAERMNAKARFATEFAAVTDVPLVSDNERHRFVRDTLRDVGIEPVPMEGFAVWVAKLRPMLLQ